MEYATLLKQTLHVEVLLINKVGPEVARIVAEDIRKCLTAQYTSVQVNDEICGYGKLYYMYHQIITPLTRRQQKIHSTPRLSAGVTLPTSRVPRTRPTSFLLGRPSLTSRLIRCEQTTMEDRAAESANQTGPAMTCPKLGCSRCRTLL